MKKAISFILIFLTILSVFSGCTTSDYVVDETKTVVIKNLYNDIEKIQSLKDDPNSSKSKNEFLQTFEEAAGLALPNSFVYPPTVEHLSGWAYVVENSCFQINTHFIAQKTEALKMLKFLKKDDNWRGFLYWKNNFYSGEDVEKDKSKCTYFKKGNWNASLGSVNIISLNFHYNKEYDNYTIWLFAIIKRQ